MGSDGLLSRTCFREYDIRGVYGRDLDEGGAYRVGLALGEYLRCGDVVVGRDGRLSSPQLASGVVEGLLDRGCSVLDIGVVPTPAFYWAVRRLEAKGGAMVTASHNPPEWNGFKLVREGAKPLARGFGLEVVEELALSDPSTLVSGEKGIRRGLEILGEYVTEIASLASVGGSHRVAVDASSGVAALTAPQALSRIGCDVRVLNGEVDGRFPSHPPEPLPEYLEELVDEVRRGSYELGVAFDGDGDRSAYVDDRGRVLTGDQALAILSMMYLEDNPGGAVVFDVSSSSVVRDVVEELGGVPVEVRVGSAFVKEKMLEVGAVLGGERSGHMYFSELGGTDDATFAALKMVEVVDRLGPLSILVDSLPRYHMTSASVECPDELKRAMVEAVASRIAEAADRVDRLDGVKAWFGGSWVLIRASNTQPLIRVTAESKSREEAERLVNEVLRMLREVRLDGRREGR